MHKNLLLLISSIFLFFFKTLPMNFHFFDQHVTTQRCDDELLYAQIQHIMTYLSVLKELSMENKDLKKSIFYKKNFLEISSGVDISLEQVIQSED